MGKRSLEEGEDAEVVKESEGGSDEEQPVEVRPIGEVIKRSNKGKAERRHYEAVELDGARYDLVSLSALSKLFCSFSLSLSYPIFLLETHPKFRARYKTNE